MTYEQAMQELNYVRGVDPRAVGANFNYDPRCFARYCNSMANAIDRAGFHLVAEDVRQARDVANPEFRSEARAAGRKVAGTVVAA